MASIRGAADILYPVAGAKPCPCISCGVCPYAMSWPAYELYVSAVEPGDDDTTKWLESSVASRNASESGFDLRVFRPSDPSEVAWGTRVRAIVLSRLVTVDGRVDMQYAATRAAYDLRARSSLPRTFGWFLGNGVGLCDMNYTGELKASLFQIATHPAPKNAEALDGARALQIVAPDCQPFFSVNVVSHETYEEMSAWLNNEVVAGVSTVACKVEEPSSKRFRGDKGFGSSGFA